MAESVKVPTGESSSENANVENAPGYCRVCGLPSTAFCRNCGDAYYCSKEHQKSDWKKHKRECFPVQFELGADGVKNLKALKEIKQNEIFLKEVPLVVFPHRGPRCFDVCLECCTEIEPQNEDDANLVCQGCGWKLCCPQCQQNSRYHSPNECQIFSKAGVKSENIDDEKVDKYFVIGMIRALLLREKDANKWKQLCSVNTFKLCRQKRDDDKTELGPYVAFIRDECNLVEFDEEIIDFVFGALKANSVDLIDYHSLTTRNVSLLFPKATQTGPSCVPNARFSIHGSDTGDFWLKMLASVPIPQGSAISTSFEQGMTATFIRRSVKEQLFFRECACERCKDPTELGTHLSSIRCRACKTGYYLQIDPLIRESEWKCDHCSVIVNNQVIVDIIEEASEVLKNTGADTTLTNVENILKYLGKLKKDQLHPNHFLIVNGEIDVCKRLLALSTVIDISDKGSLISELSRHILTVADVLAPGNSRLRGHILYFLQFGLVTEMLRENRLTRSTKKLKEGMERARKKRLDDCKKCQAEIHEIFQVEPEESEEILMLNTMKANTEILSCL